MSGIWLENSWSYTKDYLAQQRAKRQAANADLAKVLWEGWGVLSSWGAICGCEILTHFFGQSCSYIWNSVVSKFGTALWNTFNIRIRRQTTKDDIPCRGTFVTQPLPVSLCILLSTDWLYSFFLIRYFDSQKRLKLWNSYFFKIWVSVQSHIPKSKVA